MRNVLLALGMIICGTALARVPDPTVSALRVTGGACASDPARVKGGFSRTAESDFNYGITFAGNARSVARTVDEAHFDCQIAVDVTPPPGHGLRIKRFVIGGKHRTKGDSYTQAGSYYYAITEHDVQLADMNLSIAPKLPARQQGDDGEALIASSGLGTSEGAWQATFKDEMSMVSPCGKRVTLEGSLVLTASNDAAAGPFAEIMVASNGVGSDFAWGWTFEDCRWLQGRWHSTYEAPSGDEVRAEINVNGASGTYRTNGFTGQLSDIRYSEDGETVTARWKVGASSGWLEFTRNSRGAFSGSWGHQPGEYQGGWYGRR